MVGDRHQRPSMTLLGLAAANVVGLVSLYAWNALTSKQDSESRALFALIVTVPWFFFSYYVALRLLIRDLFSRSYALTGFACSIICSSIAICNVAFPLALSFSLSIIALSAFTFAYTAAIIGLRKQAWSFNPGPLLSTAIFFLIYSFVFYLRLHYDWSRT